MRLEGQLVLSATDIARHLGCRYLTQLDRAAAEGRLEPRTREDPVLEALRERGQRHEAAYEEHLRSRGLAVVHLDRGASPGDVAGLMRAGADVIAQAPLADGRLGGIADYLRRVPTPSDLGDFSYEVTDTKLAVDTKAGTILQLSLYSELVGAMQGTIPERMHVVRPGTDFAPETFRVDDFGAYYRLVKARLLAAVSAPDDGALYPVRVEECAVCRWWTHCQGRWREDDHLSLVAGMSALHAAEFERQGITTLERLGDAHEALPGRPARGAMSTYERLQAQARIQLEGRRAGALRHERLPLEEERGLQRLPAPSPGDVFFDIEAARLHEEGGLEYLLGWCATGPSGARAYHARWARDRNEERRAFEEFMDAVMAAWDRDPGMHVYHYTPYEPSALKRLMGRYGTREAELDRLLRAGRLVDLHTVARQGVRASVERYSLKDLERFAGYERAAELREASRARRRIEAVLDDPGAVLADADRALVEAYNREDCEATEALRDWLEALRAEWVGEGAEVARPPLGEGTASEAVSARDAEVRQVAAALRAGLPEDRTAWNEVHTATGLLAAMLSYHRREENCGHWEFFRLHDLDADALLDERKAIAGLTFDGTVAERRKIPVHRYRYPAQDSALEAGNKVYEVGAIDGDLGTVMGHDLSARTIDIKKRRRTADRHPAAIMVDDRVSPQVKAGSLLAFARSVAEHGLDGDGPFRAGRDLVLRRPPRRRNAAPGPVRGAGEDLRSAAIRLAHELDHGLLPVQGPPGSGKTYLGARMILDLSDRFRVGVTAVSHKVIRNLLDAVSKAAAEVGRTVRLAHKAGQGEGADGDGPIREIGENAEAIAALDEGCVVGGTAWLWSKDEAVETLDYLFVDEAGQMSMADVLAVSRAARNIVLLGDPQQLEQPQQAAHPEGTDVAALVHMLDGRQTLPPDKGLFLDTTWRLHPEIAAFTSELYYEGRLAARDGNGRWVLSGPTQFAPAGLRYVPVDHEGNQNDAPEEVSAIRGVVADLLQPGVRWTDAAGGSRPLAAADILIVAPYNAQVAALQRALPGMRIGTVDKFQGQEAAVVVYSVTSSSREDAPRGMRFLYDPNRFNVATSRARSVVIVVGNPRVFAPECHTPEQMRWANGLCRFRELAREVCL
jgi:uncharacterized protein